MRRRPMPAPRPRWEPFALLVILLSLVATPQASAETLPTASYTITGIAGNNGWYRGSAGGDFVRVNWTYNDPDSLVYQGCTTPEPVGGPTQGARGTCVLTLTDGRQIPFQTSIIKIDRDPPTGVTPGFSRAADFNGWLNHPVVVKWQGNDATSGIASCSSVTYSGPDAAAAPIGGGCTDNAGNYAPAPVSISYDSTAPVLSKAVVDSRNGSDVVSWKSSSAADTAVVQRWQRGTKNQPVVFRGAGGSFLDKHVAAGLEYTYAVQTFDQAGNASKRLLVAGLAKVVTMRRLPYVPRVAAQPILRWAAVKGARYYNVQLYRGSKRVYAAWPTTNQLGLPAVWRWARHTRRLSPGRYRWYVWAGFGARSFARYRTVGSAQFVVPR
jgi:hypothetical protein